MDNLTHTLVGLIVGESAARATRADPAGLASDTRRNLFVSLMAIGSNVPDLDFIQSRITGSKLDYLLHHRGHTHTLLGAIALSLILYLCCEAWCRWRGHRTTPRDRQQLVGIGLVASLLHIVLDLTNSYGVHPFWPFDNRWYYGDAVFIVEPLFWAASAPLLFLLRSKFAKTFVAVALFAGIGLSVATGIVPKLMCVVLAAVTIAMIMVGKFASARVALATSIAVWFSVNAMFMATSAIAADRARASAASAFPNERLLDHVLAPMPANPFCWSLILVQENEDQWFIRRASLALAPQWLPANRCPMRSDPSMGTAPVNEIDIEDQPAIAWINEIVMERAPLNEWIERDCAAAQFMRFARAPWLALSDKGWILGDARFDNERGLSFAEIALGDGRTPCISYVPPWVPPREDLLVRSKE